MSHKKRISFYKQSRELLFFYKLFQPTIISIEIHTHIQQITWVSVPVYYLVRKAIYIINGVLHSSTIWLGDDLKENAVTKLCVNPQGFYYSPKLVVADLVEAEYNISDERREKPWFYWVYIDFIEMVDWLICKDMIFYRSYKYIKL